LSLPPSMYLIQTSLLPKYPVSVSLEWKSTMTGAPFAKSRDEKFEE
jgi:hypothetical protein